jgi:DNA mismatch repair protein MutL
MSKIKILPENICNKIAAGEVVHRPESVVKELLENAIDAKASVIELIIRRAGKSLIQVVDNGEGMSEEDAILCIQKHATSKIYDYDDLENIATLGFRGEALSAIAAVGQLEIKTEMKADDIGTLVRLEESATLVRQKGSFPKGTSVSVKNLFYNTPARRNFLKSDATELKHIVETFNKIAISHPGLTFRFYNDDDLIFNYASGSVEERLKQVFDENILDVLIPVNEITDYITITGYVGKPAVLKKNKGEQYLFLNNRYVVSRQINHAVFTAFENLLEKGDYPFFILFVQLDQKRIDVNIHPSKLEVRFEDERDIYNFILSVIKKSIGTHDLVPAAVFNENDPDKLRLINYNRSSTNDFSDRPVFNQEGPRQPRMTFSDKEVDMIFSAIPENLIRHDENENIPDPFERLMDNKIITGTDEKTHSLKEPEETSSFIFQLHRKYILSQIRSGLMIIDQHVAHERILYEKALNRFDADLPFSQQLLFPRTLELDPGAFALITELKPFLVKLGFELKFFSRNTVVIEGVPDDIKRGTEEQVLIEILKEYIENRREKKLEQKDNIAKSYSCKAAIKAGDSLTEKEMRLLIDQLFATSMPYVCPHGRPIIIKISTDELDKKFGRI